VRRDKFNLIYFGKLLVNIINLSNFSNSFIIAKLSKESVSIKIIMADYKSLFQGAFEKTLLQKEEIKEGKPAGG
jgi:hypothetical protein